MLEKPCIRPRRSDGSLADACHGVVRKTTRRRLNDARYCCLACASRHRLEIGGHPFQLRTRETILQNAAKAGRTRGERAKKRKLQDIGARLSKLLPPDLDVRLGARELARLKALLVRAYCEGKEDGYQAGHTAAWRGGKKSRAA